MCAGVYLALRRMSEPEMKSVAVRRKRKPFVIDKACSKRGRNDHSHFDIHGIEKLLLQYEERAHNEDADSSCTSVWMALNVVLDNCSFEKTLLQHDLSARSENRVVPVVSREYEESFMRPCLHEEETPCSLGLYCECNFIDEHKPFVGVSFVMPELRSEETSMCILCLRKLTQMLFYRVAEGHTAAHKLLQTYGNICDVAGEYHSSAMLIMPAQGPVHCMPLPVVAHQRNKYYVVVRNGHPYLKQRMVYFEDFTETRS